MYLYIYYFFRVLQYHNNNTQNKIIDPTCDLKWKKKRKLQRWELF